MQGNGSKFAGYYGRITVIAVKLLEFWIIVPGYCHLTTGVNVTRRIATLSPHHRSKCAQAYRQITTGYCRGLLTAPKKLLLPRVIVLDYCAGCFPANLGFGLLCSDY